MCVAREVTDDPDNRAGGGGGIDTATAKHQAWSAGSVMLLFMLTWLFGLLALHKPSNGLEWLFCIFNAVMGMVMFFSRCVFYPRAQSAWIRLIGGQSSKQEGIYNYRPGTERWPTAGRDSDMSSTGSQSFSRRSDVFAKNSIITNSAATQQSAWYRNVLGDDLPTPPSVHRRPSPVSDGLKYGRSNVNFNNSESVSGRVDKHQTAAELAQVYDTIDQDIQYNI